MRTTIVKKDVVSVEQEALKFFLESVKKEFNDGFSFFAASIDHSAKLPQLRIRENGKL